jgi:flagellar basal-body rod protein FlgC
MKEMVDMLSATRAYEANSTVISTIKGMAQKAIDIGNK